MSAIATPRAEKPRLRLSGVAVPSREDQQQYTLRDAFQNVTLPVLNRRRRSPGTIASYERAVTLFETVFPHNPPISGITHEDLDRFPLALLEQDELPIRATTTANKALARIIHGGGNL